MKPSAWVLLLILLLNYGWLNVWIKKLLAGKNRERSTVITDRNDIIRIITVVRFPN